jgi:hypothetical protein
MKHINHKKLWYNHQNEPEQRTKQTREKGQGREPRPLLACRDKAPQFSRNFFHFFASRESYVRAVTYMFWLKHIFSNLRIIYINLIKLFI